MSNEFAGIKPVTSNWMKFETQGDTITGTLLKKAEGENFDGDPCPELTIIDTVGDEIKVSCGTDELHNLVLEMDDELVKGVQITITFTGM